MANKDLVKFIKEARRRGFEDYEIREPLLKKGWPSGLIEEAFDSVDSVVSSSKGKIVVKIYLDSKVYDVVRRRAKRNLLGIEEQIEDIIRRSAVNLKIKKLENEKIDDLLVSIFSRSKKGRKAKN